MPNKLINKNSPDGTFYLCKNAEASASIPVGSPVVLALNGTDDGLAVVLPSSASAALANNLAFGVALQTMAAGGTGKVQVSGFCRAALIVNRTRAATNATWQTTAALSVNQILAIDTVNNAFSIGGAAPTFYGTGANASSDTLGYPTGLWAPMAVVAQTAASSATQASSLGPVATNSSATYKVFLRML